MDRVRPSIAPQDLYASIGTAAAPIVIDVRTDTVLARAEKLVPSAIRRSPDQIAQWCNELPRGRPVVVYCTHGREVSQDAVATLRAAGLPAVYLAGGIEEWLDRRLPTRRNLGASSAWVSRERPEVDRIACPWLISRFVDPHAEFIHVATSEGIPVAKKTGRTPDDVGGAELTHEGERCTFDSILRIYEIRDPALDRFAAIIRGADTSHHELTPQCGGLSAVLLGLSANFPNDDDMLAQGMTIYDALYTWCRSLQEERHDWVFGQRGTEPETVVCKVAATMKRIGSMSILLRLSNDGDTKQTANYEALREAIVTGEIEPNQRLPSTREFSRIFDISRGTAVIVYEMLQAEGYLVGRRGTGTFVAPTLPDDRLVMRKGGARIGLAAETALAGDRGSTAALSLRGHQASITQFGENGVRNSTPFLPYLPALSEFPIASWARLTAKHARLVKPDLLDHGHVAGWPRLRRAIAAYLRSTRGIDCQGEQIILTSSTQQSLALCARLLTERGDHALMEDPGNPQALAILRGAGLTAIPVPVDAHGMRISPDGSFAGRLRLAYVTPAHQYPTGVVMSPERRQTLLDWATCNEAWIFEEDDQSEFRYSGHPLPALYGTGRSTCVLHAGSFEKTLFPALCISYLVVPPSLVDVFARAQSLFGRSPTILSQLVLCDFLESGHFDRHIRRMAECYRERRDALIESLGAQFGSSIDVVPPPAGLALPVQWKCGRDASTIAEAAAAQKLRVLPSSSFQIETPVASGAILGFAAFEIAVLQNAVKRLADAIEMREKPGKVHGALGILPPAAPNGRLARSHLEPVSTRHDGEDAAAA